MQTKVVLICFAAAALLAGCSKPGEQPSSGNGATEAENGSAHVPDYRNLLTMPGTPHNDANYIAYQHAKMLCNESPTPTAADNNAWCGVVDKANQCSSSIFGPAHTSVGSVLTAYAKDHPSADCPPK